MIRSPADAVSTVLGGLQRPVPTCYLVEVPPGCDEPDFGDLLKHRLDVHSPLDLIWALVSVDACASERALVEALIAEWCFRCVDLRRQWVVDVAYARELQPPQLLKAFFSSASLVGRPLVQVARRFDKLMRSMSSELLAAMRDLEHEGRLASVNVSPLKYDELYRRRAREVRGFNSDYGQVHVRLTVGLLDRDEALVRWKCELGTPAEADLDALSEAHFETALSFSGGLRTAFVRAIRAIPDHRHLDPDLRHYRGVLLEQLPDAFERLLRYDDLDDGCRLLEAVAAIHLGTATASEHCFVEGHRWAALLLREEEGLERLTCDALGRQALAMLRARRHDDATSPQVLYERHEYRACAEALRRHAGPNRLLQVAAEICAEVFGDAPRGTYFDRRVRWRRVERLAAKAVEASSDDGAAAGEFRCWERVASALSCQAPDGPAGVVAALEGLRGRGASAIEEAAIRLGVHVIAVRRDVNAVTSAYAAVPLVEDTLRHFAALVLDLPLTGEAFAQIDGTEVAKWWVGRGEFRRPGDTEALSGAPLALLVAIVSGARNKPVFARPEELSRLTSLLDTRNVFGHYVVSPPGGRGRALASAAEELLDRMCRDGGSQLTVRELERWLLPPRRFLHPIRA